MSSYLGQQIACHISMNEIENMIETSSHIWSYKILDNIEDA
jgi:hypothetical protein